MIKTFKGFLRNGMHGCHVHQVTKCSYASSCHCECPIALTSPDSCKYASDEALLRVRSQCWLMFPTLSSTKRFILSSGAFATDSEGATKEREPF